MKTSFNNNTNKFNASELLGYAFIGGLFAYSHENIPLIQSEIIGLGASVGSVLLNNMANYYVSRHISSAIDMDLMTPFSENKRTIDEEMSDLLRDSEILDAANEILESLPENEQGAFLKEFNEYFRNLDRNPPQNLTIDKKRIVSRTIPKVAALSLLSIGSFVFGGMAGYQFTKEEITQKQNSLQLSIQPVVKTFSDMMTLTFE